MTLDQIHVTLQKNFLKYHSLSEIRFVTHKQRQKQNPDLNNPDASTKGKSPEIQEDPKTTTVTTKYVIISFFDQNEAKLVLENHIPKTTSNFAILNARSQIALDATDDDSYIKPGDFTDHKAKKSQRDALTVLVTNIPLSFDNKTIHTALSKYGNVVEVRLRTKGIWQQAFVAFDHVDSVNIFRTNWGIVYLKHFLKVAPLQLSNEDFQLRTKHTLKLTGLPHGTTVIDLIDIINATKAKAINIPRSVKSYQGRPYAFFNFESEAALRLALQTEYAIAKADLSWVTIQTKVCGICGSPSHMAKTCPKNNRTTNKKYQELYYRYKPANYKKLVPNKPKQSRQQTQQQQGRRPWNAANNRLNTYYADAAAGKSNDVNQDKGLNDSVHNPRTNGRHSDPKRGKNFEQSVLDALDNINNKFDEFAKRLTVLERRLADMEAEFNYNDDQYLDGRLDEEDMVTMPQPPPRVISDSWMDDNENETETNFDSSAFEYEASFKTPYVSPHAKFTRPAQDAFTSPEENDNSKRLRLENEQLKQRLASQSKDLLDVRKEMTTLIHEVRSSSSSNESTRATTRVTQ